MVVISEGRENVQERGGGVNWSIDSVVINEGGEKLGCKM
jgi:hypothetical protein